MSASRKLYVTVAEKFREVSHRTDENDRHVWRATVLAAAFAFRLDNSGFDKRRFLKASGWADDELAAYADTL
jgi:hypothetical protein